MNVVALCADENRPLLREAIREHFGTYTVMFSSRHDMPHSPNGIVVVDHSIVCALKPALPQTWDRAFLFYSGIFIQLSEEDELVRRRDSAVRAKDWTRAKRINDALIDINFLKGNAISTAMPDYLQIETTSFCNARCIMCSHYFSDNNNAGFLADETLTHLLDAVQLSHTISLNGMGEPFISPLLQEQIDFYANLGNRIVSNTNLSVLNERLLDQISNHFDWLEVSCDGASRETYEAIRQGLSFDVFINNLALLRERCPNVRIHIATVVMRQNVHEMPKMVELASRAGASVVTFMTLNANIIINNQLDEMLNYPRVLEYYSSAALSEGEKAGIAVVVPNMDSINRDITFEEIEEELAEMKRIPEYKDALAIQKMRKTAAMVDRYLEAHDEIQRDTKPSAVRCSGICDWLLKRSYIDLQGNVAMCCRNQSFHAGNVNESKSFGAVWNSQLYVKLREIFYSGFLPEACLKCGLIESGNLKHLNVRIDEAFYEEAAYKLRQKQTLKKLLEA